ncbi:hypothetical protein TSTA_034540 [Talaromyces stipitatus ATCC 10500]|uniref:HTH psq-type domain-containing protein n=1 Tax=Talaromyces stipitatus (strain ATCC 10500 / CBS 375.48 / QM 6759 / NRRL 1006) TaxID=441959 RepID=B8M6Z6_TALSN|nr:uncharacterized protein TSTA_034540 [Talaromyces stipitatus ATCC 10500]EED20216.1 hypothetical protein TSTA_034540 [Talaromyces stipitatus ATCC 10500]
MTRSLKQLGRYSKVEICPPETLADLAYSIHVLVHQIEGSQSYIFQRPKHHQMTAEEYKKKEIIAKAVNAYKRGKIKNILRLAREFGVSRSKLYRRVSGTPSCSTRPPTNRLLSLDQEKALTSWVQYLDNMGAAPTALQIEENANCLLLKDFTGPGTPRRAAKIGYTNISNVYQKNINESSKNLKELNVRLPGIMVRLNGGLLISNWLWMTSKLPPRIFTTLTRLHLLLERGKRRQWLQHTQKHQKGFLACLLESLTVVECINAEGKVIPPLIIPKGEKHMEEWYKHIKDED